MLCLLWVGFFAAGGKYGIGPGLDAGRAGTYPPNLWTTLLATMGQTSLALGQVVPCREMRQFSDTHHAKGCGYLVLCALRGYDADT